MFLSGGRGTAGRRRSIHSPVRRTLCTKRPGDDVVLQEQTLSFIIDDKNQQEENLEERRADEDLERDQSP